MSINKVVTVVFNLLGAMLCLLAVVAGGISATALVARIQHGRGIMFADVEFFALTALGFLVPGITLLIGLSTLIAGSPAENRTTSHSACDSIHHAMPSSRSLFKALVG
jgi:uncharacterized BrkB/YihY/UPF0761 family membrane protein